MGKNNDTIIFVIIGIIIVGAFLWQGGYFGELFSMVRHGGELQISNLDFRTWSASETSHTAAAVGANGIINLVITHPSENGVKQGMWCDKINSVTNEVCPPRGSVDGDSATSNWNSRVGTQYTKTLGKQFMVMEGTYNDGDCISHPFKTYGMCEGFSCYIYDPAPDIEPAMGNCYRGELFPTSIKIYFKAGGYTEEAGKAEFNLIPPVTYYRFENNICNEISILESAKTTNDYLTLSECQTHIIACNPADTNCDNIISRDELGVYINNWIAGSVTRDNLGLAIQGWVNG